MGPSLQILVFSAEPGSASHDHDGLQLLANWADTHSDAGNALTNPENHTLRRGQGD